MPDLLHASLIPYTTSFLARFYLEGLFPDTWQEFAPPWVDYSPDGYIEFRSPAFTLQLNALTGSLREWRFHDTDLITDDWKSLQSYVVSRCMGEDVIKLEFENGSRRDFGYHSKTGTPGISIAFDVDTRELHIWGRFYSSQVIYRIGLMQPPFNTVLPPIEQVQFSPQQVQQIALYFMTKGKSSLRFPLFKDAVLDNGADLVILDLAEDVWLDKRYIWELNFEFGIVRINAQSGQLQGIEGFWHWRDHDYADRFGSDTEIVYEKPSFPYAPAYPYWSSQKENKEREGKCGVTFNGVELYYSIQGGGFGLRYFPLRRGESCLIFAGYFPSFLIDMKRDGANIVLQGQLPTKGHRVELTIGSIAALLDGQSVNLSAEPEQFEDRLYLPYELLSLCNGVSTTFEPSENMLFVETSHLRRPA